MSDDGLVFNPPPGWPAPPAGWRPPAGWKPHPDWPPAPPDWKLWIAAAPPPVVSTTVDDPRAALGSAATAGVRSSLTSDLGPRVAILEAENAALRNRLEELGRDPDALVALDDERVLQSVGIYRYHHPLENADAYRERLEDLGNRIAELVKIGKAIEMSSTFTFDGSLAKGRRMTEDLSKLMLRAYNAEAENGIRCLRLGNVVTAKGRLDASRTAIAKLGRMMEMRISDAFHALRLEELELTADWLMKKEEEKERAREERAQLREERRVEQELAEERERLEKERAHLQNAVEALSGSESRDPELEARIKAIDDAIAQNDYRAANIRAGYVYVISNRGAFGEGVVKIGLTRRLDPMERVDELGGASVPFRFDVHALFFSEDAVSLEAQLHQEFATLALNQANSRKEFFFVTPAEARSSLAAKVGNLLEFNEHAEATEYWQSLRHWPEGRTR